MLGYRKGSVAVHVAELLPVELIGNMIARRTPSAPVVAAPMVPPTRMRSIMAMVPTAAIPAVGPPFAAAGRLDNVRGLRCRRSDRSGVCRHRGDGEADCANERKGGDAHV